MVGSEWEERDYFPEGSDQKALVKRFVFTDFAEALAFTNSVGELAEAANHHPDINLGWGYAQVWLTSHDAHAITDKDHKLAERIDALA